MSTIPLRVVKPKWIFRPRFGYTRFMPDITLVLAAINAGDPRAASQLLPLVYDELRKLAAARMASERPDHSLNATALVHEAYLRLVGDQQFENRGHFFAAAAEAMRRILVDQARRRRAAKHGGLVDRQPLGEIAAPLPDPQLLVLHDALDDFARSDPDAARLVHDLWTYARTWLHRQMRRE